ncbi:MarR family transcriptional regulator [Aerococcus viridans]|uniref:MarR family transcriptional regulator n=2 Tax=Aerococcus viridans TaxID=1377 RepID=A0A2N6UFD2_9LACT|nr:MarR family transcriptional regulator [Aerococcus viridans]
MIEKVTRMKDEHQPMYIGGLLRELTIAVHRNIGVELSEHELGDMKGPQSMALGYIIHASTKDELYVKDLEKYMKIRKSTASELVSRLEKNGYVRTEKSQKDGRLKRLIVTEEGHEAHDRILYLLQEVDDRLVAGLSQEEVDTFVRILNKLIQNMQS